MKFNRTYIIATTHEFKNNISRLTRLLETGAYSSVFVKRRDEIVGIYLHKGARDAFTELDERARKNGTKPVNTYEDDLFRQK